jgi:hypothetical protein
MKKRKNKGSGGAAGRRGNLSVVVLPDATGDLVAAEVEGLELDLADAQLLRRRVLRRLVLHEPLRSDPIRADPCTATTKSNRIGNPQRQGKSEEDENFARKGRETNLVLEHVEEGGLASVVEAEEEDLSLLLPQPQRGQHPVEPVHQEHLDPSAPAISSRSSPHKIGRRLPAHLLPFLSRSPLSGF